MSVYVITREYTQRLEVAVVAESEEQALDMVADGVEWQLVNESDDLFVEKES